MPAASIDQSGAVGQAQKIRRHLIEAGLKPSEVTFSDLKPSLWVWSATDTWKVVAMIELAPTPPFAATVIQAEASYENETMALIMAAVEWAEASGQTLAKTS